MIGWADWTDHVITSNMDTYTQPLKASARRTVLEHAVSCLTKDRRRSVLVPPERLRTVVKYAASFLVKYGFDRRRLRDLDATLDTYTAYHRESIGRRRPSELKVLYLCGPEPVNDLSVLMDLGCRPENIWALERKSDLFAAAVAQLKDVGAFIRVHHGSLHSFFSQFGGQFDLVYFDGCGPLPGGNPNTVMHILSLFSHERLADLSVLVTNLAQYPQAKSDAYVRLMAHYFSPCYSEVPRTLWDQGYDPALAHGDPEYAVSFMRRCGEAVYSDFVTRLLSDIGRSVVPWAKIGSNPDVVKKFFASDKILTKARKDSKRSTYEYPLLAFLEGARRDQFAGPLIESLANFPINGKKLLDAYRPAALLEGAYAANLDLASPEMLAVLRTGWVDSEKQYFCDIPMPNLAFSMLAGTYGRPHFVNPERCVRLSYTAKTTRMYTDVLVFDRCRSFFDYSPSIELVPAFLDSASRQLVLRGCIDQIGWHDFSSAARPFRYSAIGGMGEHSAARSREFPERTYLVQE